MLEPHDTELARLIVENAVDYAIFTIDGEGRITRWSDGAEKLLGYSRDEAIGMDFAQLFPPSDRQAGMDKTEVATTLAKGRAEDTRWHVRKSGERFWANGVTIAVDGSDNPTLLKIMRDETTAKRAEDQRILLLNELNHRIKNTLTIVQSIVEQTLRSDGDNVDARQNLIDRIITLSHAHDVLVAQNWAGADLQAIARLAIAPHDPSGAAVSMDGPDTRLSPQQAVSMSLIVHELGTNAVKYGALSTPDGRVSISWNLAQDGLGARSLTFLWEEHGGPPVRQPTRRGFGARMIAQAVRGSGAGEAKLEFAEDGVRCVIVMPLGVAGEASEPLDITASAPPPVPGTDDGQG